MNAKVLYCVSRAEELSRKSGLTFMLGYKQAEREWNKKNHTSTSYDEYDYDDDIDYNT